MTELKIQSKGRGELASKDEREGWVNSSIEDLTLHCEITKSVISATRNPNVNPEMFEIESALERLKNGEIVYLPMIKFRAIVGEEVCVLCGATFKSEMGSLSRKDNETIICSACGTEEAMEDYFQEKK